MIGMRVVEVALDEIIDVIAVRHRLVAATGSVLMSGRVPAAAVLRGAVVWMVSIYRDRMLVDMIAVHVMEMPVMQIVYMTAVADGDMPTTSAVLVRVAGVLRVFAIAHRLSPR
jgi:hypothetical protein